MRTRRTVICLLAGAFVSTAWAQEGKVQPPVKLVNETKVLELAGFPNCREALQSHSMRLSPDGNTLLYIKKVQEASKTSRAVYRLFLRSIKTCKDRIVPGEPSLSCDLLTGYVGMNPFSANGENMVIPIGGVLDEAPTQARGVAAQAGVFEIASGDLTKLDPTGSTILPLYDVAGSNIILFLMGDGKSRGDLKTSRLLISPARKIAFT